MASRYWVGGTASWDGTAGSKWATTSGGAGGASIPTSSDNVFIDANSGSVSVTIATGNTGCLSLDMTGFTGQLSRLSGGLSIAGSFTAGAGMAALTPGVLTFSSTTSGNTLTFNGRSIGSGANGLTFDGVGGIWTLQDNLSSNGNSTITLTNGTFNTNGNNINHVGGFNSSNSNVRTWDMTNSTLTCNVGSSWNFSTTTNLTLTTTGSTVVMVSSASSAFQGGGKTYNIVNVTGTTGTVTFIGSNTFTTLSVSAGVTHTFTAGTTQTVTNFLSTGSYGKLALLKSGTNGSAWNLSKSSGTVNVNFVSLQDSAVAGGATFNAYGSTNVSGNTGWNFLTLPAGMFMFF